MFQFAIVNVSQASNESFVAYDRAPATCKPLTYFYLSYHHFLTCHTLHTDAVVVQGSTLYISHIPANTSITLVVAVTKLHSMQTSASRHLLNDDAACCYSNIATAETTFPCATHTQAVSQSSLLLWQQPCSCGGAGGSSGGLTQSAQGPSGGQISTAYSGSQPTDPAPSSSSTYSISFCDPCLSGIVKTAGVVAATQLKRAAAGTLGAQIAAAIAPAATDLVIALDIINIAGTVFKCIDPGVTNLASLLVQQLSM